MVYDHSHTEEERGAWLALFCDAWLMLDGCERELTEAEAHVETRIIVSCRCRGEHEETPN